MATVPTIDFRVEDITDGGSVSPQKVVDALNRIGRAYRESMSHGITAENLRSQDVTLTFTTEATVADTFPLPVVALADYMPGSPSSVRILSRRNLTTQGATFTAASDVDWMGVEGRKVAIRYITGLSASTRYQVTLRIEG